MAEKAKVVILGAGVGGLAAGYFLARTGQYDVTVLERAPVIGGLCGTFEHDGFQLDYGAHKLYSVIPGVLEEIEQLMAGRLLTLPKQNRLFLRGHLVDYPLKLGNLARVLGFGMFLKLGYGFGLELIKGIFNRTEPASYEDYIIRRFGRPTFELVFKSLAEKVWGDPASLHPEMARTRVPASGGIEVVLKLLGLKKESAETNAEFFYYPRAGFGDFPQALREQIEAAGGRVLTEIDITGMQMAGPRIQAVETAQGRFEADYVVSSLPLPLLGRMVLGADDAEFNQAVTGLQFRHLILVYIFARRDLALQDQWIFFPEHDFRFSRIFEQKQMNPAMGPAGRTAITADFTADEDSAIWQASDEELAQQVIQGLIRGGFLAAQDVEGHLVVRRRNFYPRYDLAYATKMKLVSDRLRQVDNLLTTGRIGMYNYNNSDHCTDMGKFIAERLIAGDPPPAIWAALEARVADYRIVD